VKVVYLCLPNTPTGVVLPAVDVAAWAEAHPQTVVILDQSFLSLCDRFEDACVSMPPNVVRVRSLTKDHAIPGVRVGYIIATPKIVARVEEQRPAWSTSSIAQAAALVACRERRFLEESRPKLLADRTRMTSRLRGLGLCPLESSTPFFLVRVAEATELRMRLLARHGILVRDCASFGLPGFIRLAARPEPDCERLMAALKDDICR
jgi:histidinol-phosphate/aromatic aminotransferase/cobyric acid decarboxylase-like protein